MRAILSCMCGSLGLLALLAFGSVRAADGSSEVIRRPDFWPAPEFARADLQGTVSHFMDGGFIKVWQIKANGFTFVLESTKDLTRLKDGMTIRVTGKLVYREQNYITQSGPYPPIARYEWVIVADTVDIVADGIPRRVETFAKIKLRGKLQLDTPLGYPARTRNVVSAGGQMFVVDFGIMTGVGLLNLQELNGKMVDLEGDITGFADFTVMCVPGSTQLPILRVASTVKG
jgi:hypothetical protein